LALWFPHLPTDRILRRRLGQSWRSRPEARSAARERTPLVVSRRESNTRCIAALDEQAEALGLKRGAGIADACAMHLRIEVVEADPAADRRLLESLADWCDRYTPLAALDGEDGLFLDITGCAHLFGGEKAMLDDIIARFSHLGFDLRAGLASTVGAAWAAARFFASRLVEAGEEEKLLTPLPLAALRIDASMRAGLESVGLRTAGAVMDAPRAPLARRFGKLLMLRLDQALGRVEEAISPRLPAPPLSVERRLAEPVVTMEAVERLVGLLAATLRSDLERRGEGARTLQLALFRVDGAVSRIAVGTARPLRDPDRIGLLFHEKLAALEDRIDAGFGFDLVRLSAPSLARFEAGQADFSGEDASEEERLVLFADRVRARLGGHAVLKVLPVESHLPERAAAAVPFAGREIIHIPRHSSLRRRSDPLPPPLSPPHKGEGDAVIASPIKIAELWCGETPLQSSPPPYGEGTGVGVFPYAIALPPGASDRGGGTAPRIPERPIRLFASPEPVEAVAAEVPEGAPASFRWRRVFHRVAASEGPERIAPEWWRGDGNEGARDYFRVEDEEGRRFWLYRQGLYGEVPQGPRWFMHGIFA
jgi:protein ImuB